MSIRQKSDNIIDGKAIAEKILTKVKIWVDELKTQGITPKLAVILVGDNKPSQTYVRKKQEAAEKIGIDFTLHKYSADINKEQLVEEIKKIQQDEKLCGLIVQLPLPQSLYTPEVLNAVNPDVDVDCLTNDNLGRLMKKTGFILPPTPYAVKTILKELGVNVEGKNICVIGAGPLVGKPLTIILLNKQATVTICSSQTKNLKEKCLEAEIIVTAVGKNNLLRGDMVKRGAIVIDAGISFTDEKIHGDVNFAEVSKKAGHITPVPGGVGPITVALLLKNTVTCAKRKFGLMKKL
ncbi:MAG: bifunctional 5,10-methylenetetrahydrofolate dehydrogenase/5,10-methenyltetrahydrofolate cyclohydrolase [Candidatus Magasanikbacteria bacterium]|nr:bifunctional 5,10-methylenetetrahydrofolate dehydrogenase/5,10-methenyltetrahydrofolate cyclohydrolase [Candidatus Magasanikbacteria bacterium]